MSNFKRAAGMLDCTPEQALLSFVTKHITALYDFVQALGDGRCMTLDQWAEKTGDIRNYMILLDALIEERLALPMPRKPAALHSGWSGGTYYCTCGQFFQPQEGITWVACTNCGREIPPNLFPVPRCVQCGEPQGLGDCPGCGE